MLARARSSDEDAWRRLVECYGPLVHRWCRRSGLKDHDTADIFQETFRAVSAGLREFKPARAAGSFRCWLRSIVRSKIADHFRRQSQRPIAQGGTDAQVQLANLSDPLATDRWDALWAEDEDSIADENAIVVQSALKKLRREFSPRNWAAFWQVVVEGKSAVDVARAAKCTPQAIRQANYRIRRRLRAILGDLVD